MSASAEQLTRVVLAFVPERVNNRLRFGKPVRESVLDRRRCMSYFPPGGVLPCLLAGQ